MYSQNRRSKKLALAAMMAVLPQFAGCGGGGGSDDAADALGCFVAFVSLGTNTQHCPSATTTSGSSSSGSTTSPPPPPPPPPPSSGDGTIRILGQNEMEPNDSLINADPVDFSSSTESKVGFTVEGSVSDTDDIEDYFTFVRPRARTLRFQLCPPGVMICESGVQVDTLTAWFDVLDQDGNVLASSQAADSNVLLLPVDAGISYYPRVVAGDTMATAVEYKFTAYETN
jgi:hypothetical protein